MISFLEMFSWAVNPFAINESSNLFTEEEEQLIMGVRRGAKREFSPPGYWDSEPKIPRKPDINSSIPINWCISCNDTLFAAMTLTLHKATGQLQHPEFLKAFSDVRYNNKLSSFPPRRKSYSNILRSFWPTKISADCGPVPEWMAYSK